MGRAHEKSSQPMPLFFLEKVIDNKMFLKSTAGLYISNSYQKNFISHRHRIFYTISAISNISPFITSMETS